MESIISRAQQAMNSQVLHTCDVIFLMRMQGKFDIDHSSGVKGSNRLVDVPHVTCEIRMVVTAAVLS